MQGKLFEDPVTARLFASQRAKAAEGFVPLSALAPAPSGAPSAGIARMAAFAGRRGLRLSITTKSDLVLRDVDLLARVAEHNDLSVNVTVTTPHHTLSRRIEPRAPRPDKRLAAVATMARAGLTVGVFV